MDHGPYPWATQDASAPPPAPPAPAPEPAKKPKKKEKKNLSLLSFGEEAAAEEQELGAPEIGGSNPGPAGLGA